MTERLLKANRVAEILDVSTQRVYELTREGRIPFVQLGERQYRYSETALQAWLADGGSSGQRDPSRNAGKDATVMADAETRRRTDWPGPVYVSLDALSPLDQLEERGLAVEGELSSSFASGGGEVRSLIKFKQRESFLCKLLNRIELKLNISLRDFLK